MRTFLLLILCTSLFAADFDVIVVGTSPFSLFEALYQSHSGKRVLILEEASECGGAWKTISICGIPHVDLGCHLASNDPVLGDFLEVYAGCSLVQQEHPKLPAEPSTHFYFSKGCFELIEHLLHLIAATDIVLLTNTKLESVSFDPSRTFAIAHTQNQNFSTRKFILTPASCFDTPSFCKSKYYHLYLLVQDPTPPRFSYHGAMGNGIIRAMNLTCFSGLEGTGQQLIVLQVSHEDAFRNGADLLAVLKNRQLTAAEAYLLRSDPYIYEVGALNQKQIAQEQDFFEVLQTGNFGNLVHHVPKWKQVLKPYLESVMSKT